MSAIDRRARNVVDAATLAAIEREVLVDEALDETGTIEGISSAVEERFLQQQFTLQELEEVRRIDDDLVFQFHCCRPIVNRTSDNQSQPRRLITGDAVHT